MKSMTKKYSAVFVAIIIPAIAWASDPKIRLDENANANLKDFLINILNVILTISSALAVLFIIIGGLQYMTAAGDEKKTGVAKKTMTYAIIGLLLVILSLVIVNMLKAFTNTVVK